LRSLTSEVAEAVDGVEVVTEVVLILSGIIAVGDVELLRDVLPFPRTLSTFVVLLPAKAAFWSSSFFPRAFALTALALFAVLDLAGVFEFLPVAFQQSPYFRPIFWYSRLRRQYFQLRGH